MTTYYIRFVLESDATFGKGEGVAGLVDEEVEHDQYGLPFLRGRTLKGLLVEECANILFALHSQGVREYMEWEKAADQLFGRSGANLAAVSRLHIGDAQLPDDLRQLVEHQVKKGALARVSVLESLTDIRRQTAMDETGRPDDGSLRSSRVVLRKTPFVAPLQFAGAPSDNELSLLCACVLAFRRAGVGRNRGRGRLLARLLDENHKDVTQRWFNRFKEAVQ